MKIKIRIYRIVTVVTFTLLASLSVHAAKEMVYGSSQIKGGPDMEYAAKKLCKNNLESQKGEACLNSGYRGSTVILQGSPQFHCESTHTGYGNIYLWECTCEQTVMCGY